MLLNHHSIVGKLNFCLKGAAYILLLMADNATATVFLVHLLQANSAVFASVSMEESFTAAVPIGNHYEYVSGWMDLFAVNLL